MSLAFSELQGDGQAHGIDQGMDLGRQQFADLVGLIHVGVVIGNLLAVIPARRASISSASPKPFSITFIPATAKAVAMARPIPLVAESYSDGPFFIASDAAHQLSPTGGLGMNTGFGDGISLLRLAAAAPPGNQLKEGARKSGVSLTVEELDDPAVLEVYGRALVLVRPDGHVAWRGDLPPDDPEALIDRLRGG